MNDFDDLSQRSPEEIQSRIAQTRSALDSKLDKLGERLDPSVRLAEMKGEVSQRVERIKGDVTQRVERIRGDVSQGVERLRDDVSARAPQILAWGAVGAVAAGAALAAKGWRRVHHDHEDVYVRRSLADTLSENEPLGDGIVSGPTTFPRP